VNTNNYFRISTLLKYLNQSYFGVLAGLKSSKETSTLEVMKISLLIFFDNKNHAKKYPHFKINSTFFFQALTRVSPGYKIEPIDELIIF